MKPKLCIDCKHFVTDSEEWRTQSFAERYATCGITSVVNGKDGEQCRDRRRRFFDRCGKSAKQWEPK